MLEPGAEPWLTYGCTDADACNYEMAATEDDGTCFFPSAGLDCSGEPLPDFPTLATHSVARIWNEATLLSIRHDWARPTVHARNLWHTSALMYDAWAAWGEDTIVGAQPWLLGNQQGSYTCAYEGVPEIEAEDRLAARQLSISYGVYRLLQHRFANAPRAERIATHIDTQMEALGYDTAWHETDYTNGTWMERAASLGNYLAEQYIAFGFQDGSFEVIDYQNTYHNPMSGTW